MKNTLIFCYFLFLSVILYGQSKDSFLIKLSLKHDTIEMVSPLSLTVTLENHAKSVVDIYPMAISYGRILPIGQIFLEARKDYDTIWIKTDCIINHKMSGRDYLTIQKFALAPREILLSEVFTCPTPYILQNKGLHFLRIEYVTPTGESYFSDPQPLFVHPYLGQDLIAFEYLKKLTRPNFILSPISYIGNEDTSELHHAEHIATLFPKSTLGGYASLYLCLSYAEKAYVIGSDFSNKNEGLHYLRLSKQYGLSVIENKNPLITGKAIEILKQLRDILYSLFDSNPPTQLDLEFWYPYKN